MSKVVKRRCRTGKGFGEIKETKYSRMWEYMGHTFVTVRPLCLSGEGVASKGWQVLHYPSGYVVDVYSMPTREDAEEFARNKILYYGKEKFDKLTSEVEVINE